MASGPREVYLGSEFLSAWNAAGVGSGLQKAAGVESGWWKAAWREFSTSKDDDCRWATVSAWTASLERWSAFPIDDNKEVLDRGVRRPVHWHCACPS